MLIKPFFSIFNVSMLFKPCLFMPRPVFGPSEKKKEREGETERGREGSKQRESCERER